MESANISESAPGKCAQPRTRLVSSDTGPWSSGCASRPSFGLVLLCQIVPRPPGGLGRRFKFSTTA